MDITDVLIGGSVGLFWIVFVMSARLARYREDARSNCRFDNAQQKESTMSSDHLYRNHQRVEENEAFRFIAFRDCSVDLMMTLPTESTEHVKMVVLTIGGLTSKLMVMKDGIVQLNGVKLKHMETLSVKHDTSGYSAHAPFIVRMMEVLL